MRWLIIAAAALAATSASIGSVRAQKLPSVDDLTSLLMPKLDELQPVERTRSFTPGGNDLARGISTITPQQTATSQVVSLKIEFDTGSANLRPDGKAELDKLAQSMGKVKAQVRTRSARQLVLGMVGHTDHRGSDEYNNDLAARRVQAAKKYLQDYWGFGDHELAINSRGKSEPIDRSLPCDDNCMQRNRRVDVQTSLR